MTNEAVFVFGLIAVAGLLTASNKVRFYVVALLVVLALMRSGTLNVKQLLAGFGSTAVNVAWTAHPTWWHDCMTPVWLECKAFERG